MFIDSDTKYYVCDVKNGVIVTYNENWEYQSIEGFTGPVYMKQVDKDIYRNCYYQGICHKINKLK